jgi:hypothetical protein
MQTRSHRWIEIQWPELGQPWPMSFDRERMQERAAEPATRGV